MTLLNPQPTTKRLAPIDGTDFYHTPSWATHALIEVEKFSGDILEPACGLGHMSEVLKLTGNNVISTDIYDRGYGNNIENFLDTIDHPQIDNIITNPPYNLAEEFFHIGYKRTKKKLCLLLRLAFLEGINRQNTIFNITPPSKVWVFSERITFYEYGAEIKSSGTTAYAWYIWDKSMVENKTELKWIPTGIKKKYT